MNFNNYTIKSQEAIQKATEIAASNQQQIIETGHILKAVLQSDESMISFIFKKLNVNKTVFDQKLDEIIGSYPKVSGGSPSLANDASQALNKATTYLKEFGDEYVAIEHILLGLLSGRDKVATLMKDTGFNEKDLKK